MKVIKKVVSSIISFVFMIILAIASSILVIIMLILWLFEDDTPEEKEMFKTKEIMAREREWKVNEKI